MDDQVYVDGLRDAYADAVDQEKGTRFFVWACHLDVTSD